MNNKLFYPFIVTAFVYFLYDAIIISIHSSSTYCNTHPPSSIPSLPLSNSYPHSHKTITIFPHTKKFLTYSLIPSTFYRLKKRNKKIIL